MKMCVGEGGEKGEDTLLIEESNRDGCLFLSILYLVLQYISLRILCHCEDERRVY